MIGKHFGWSRDELLELTAEEMRWWLEAIGEYEKVRNPPQKARNSR